MTVLVALLILGVLNLTAGALFVVGGIRDGLIRKRIVASLSGKVVTGRRAVAHGILCIVVGAFLVFGACLMLATVVAQAN